MSAETPSAGSFRTTRRSLVLAAGRDDAGRQRALEELCALYWPAVYAFYRRSGHHRELASDLTQGLFLHLIERDDLAADAERGRFRGYLRTCARPLVGLTVHWQALLPTQGVVTNAISTTIAR